MRCQDYRGHDFFERYILGRLSRPERTDLENHLRQCSACWQALETQKLLITGLRNIGRDGMKQEIREQVEQGGHIKTVNWMRLARIAAVFFVMIITPSVYFIIRKERTLHQSVSIPTTQMWEPLSSEAVHEGDFALEDADVASYDEKSKAIPEMKRIEVPLKERTAQARLRQEKVLTEPAKPEAAGQQSLVSSADMAESHENLETERPNMLGMFTLSSGKTSLTKRSFRKKRKAAGEDSLIFSTNGDTVLIRINAQRQATDKNEADLRPGFPVKITKFDSSRIEMTWFISDTLLYRKLALSALQQMSGKSMQLILPEGRVYRIDLQADSTRAVLER